ncbi:MAG: ABC transporter ATP-binding protein [Candidatus Neomarinimicrobiota bacterium]|nr:MAG: ABC transporter ATP-binding protein [Candidatus Neomarinimicrobiota bacterium]
MEASVTLKRVGKLVHGKTILAGMSFGIEKGTIVAVVGENNAGKSMLLKVIAGFENPEHGGIFIHGLDSVRRRQEVRHLIGYVPADNDFDPWLSLKQNILFIGSLYGVSPADLETRISTMSRILRLEDALDTKVQDLPSSLVKRGMIVRALIHDPAILVMDEPTAFQDAEMVRVIWDYLEQFRGEKTIIFTSQNFSVIEQVHDRILVLREGRVLLDGTLDRLLESTTHYHQFQIEFETLSDAMYQKLAKMDIVFSPSKQGNLFTFYGRNKKVLFQVMEAARELVLVDVNLKKMGLKDLLDSEFSRQGLVE